MTSNPPSKRAEFGWPSGDHPGEVSFATPVAPEVRAAILAALAPIWPGSSDATLTALTPPDGVVSRYRITFGEATHFLRVSIEWGDPALEQAITAWLRDHDVSVNHLDLAGLHVSFAGTDFRLDTRAFVPGRHFDGSLADLHSLAALLAKCHRCLRDFPQRDTVRAHSIARSQRLDIARTNIAAALQRRDWAYFSDDLQWAPQHEAWLTEMTRSFDPYYDRLPGAQCLHAQVHRANVLFHSSDAQPVLVDFEEAVQTFAPVTWDLAYFLQRFCLHDSPDAETFAARFATVRAAYGAWPGGVVEMMRQAAWLSIAIIIASRHDQGIVNPVAEYQKFVTLEEQARRLAPWIEGDAASC